MIKLMKHCMRCNEDKKVEEFQKDHKSKDGLCYYCKLCKKEVLRKWRTSHPEKMKVSIKSFNEWKKLNPEKARVSVKNGGVKWQAKRKMRKFSITI